MRMAGSSELWIQCFTCCLHQQEPRSRNGKHKTHHRLRIDRSMIGEPTNFRHTGHISSDDFNMTGDCLSTIQERMQHKGGYDTSISVKAY